MFFVLSATECTPTEFTTRFSQLPENQTCVLLAAPMNRLMVWTGKGEPAAIFNEFPFVIARPDFSVEALTDFMAQSAANPNQVTDHYSRNRQVLGSYLG